jgi:hypothetical protein
MGELNHHHLFTSLEPAWIFREVSNQRVPEHRPFFVYGLWLIDELQAGPQSEVA